MGDYLINITNWFYVIIPMMLFGAIIGLRRGWKIEVFTAMGIFFTGLILSEAGDKLVRFVNRLPRLVNFLLDEEILPTTPFIEGDDNIALFCLGVFMIGMILFYALPNVLFKAPPGGIPGTKGTKTTWDKWLADKFFSALIGGLTGFMVFNIGLQWLTTYLATHPSTDTTTIAVTFPPISDLADPAKWLLVGKPLLLIVVLGSVFLVIIFFTVLSPSKAASREKNEKTSG